MISISKLAKTYTGRNNKVRAIKDISLDIAKGEFISIVGPSGCGKSTLLSICAGLLQPTKGTINTKGQHSGTGMVFQESVLLPWRTVQENVALTGELLGESLQTKKILSLVGLQRFAKSYPGELSGGMKQRVSLARALVTQPNLLLMDEPFGSLDEFMRNRLNLDLLKIWHKVQPTILFVTHSISEAVLLSDRVVVLSSRPSTIRKIIHINLPRPRNLDMKETVKFQEYVRCIREAIE